GSAQELPSPAFVVSSANASMIGILLCLNPVVSTGEVLTSRCLRTEQLSESVQKSLSAVRTRHSPARFGVSDRGSIDWSSRKAIEPLNVSCHLARRLASPKLVWA